MNKKLLLLYLTLFAPLIFCFSQDNNNVPKDSSSFDTINYLLQKANDLSGRSYAYSMIISDKTGIPLDSLKKKIIYLHSWFASCKPCIAEFEPLNELYLKFRKRDNFEIISFTFENEKTISEFKKKYGISYRIIHVTEQECRKLNLMGGFPTNILLSNDMVIQRIYFGGQGSDEKIRSFFRETVSSDITKLLNK